MTFKTPDEISPEDNPIDDIPADKKSYEAWQAAHQTLALLEKENAALRKEVNAIRAKLGLGRKYVEWKEKP